MQLTLSILLSLMMFTSCTSPVSQDKHVRQVEKQEWLSLIAAEEAPQIIDVRTPSEFADGTVPGATNLDFQADNFDKLIADLDKERPVYVLCQSGGRSAKACDMLSKLGHQEVIELKNGYSAW